MSWVLAVLLAQQPVEVARTRTFTEGPVFDSSGTLYFEKPLGLVRGGGGRRAC